MSNLLNDNKTGPRFGVNDDVYILDTQIYNDPKWIHGIVEEVGDETILVKWDDLQDPTEYQLSDLPDIRFKIPDELDVVRNFIQFVSAIEASFINSTTASFWYIKGRSDTPTTEEFLKEFQQSKYHP